MKQNDFLSTTELAKLLGISRIAVFKKIKQGKIKAVKVGRNYVINKKNLADIFGNVLTKKKRKELEEAVKKVVREYGETLRLLGTE